jgi:hypothetical protein
VRNSEGYASVRPKIVFSVGRHKGSCQLFGPASSGGSMVVYDVMSVGLFHFWILREILVQDPYALGVG